MLRTSLLAVVAAAFIWPATSLAAGHTETLRIFSKPQTFTITTPDGKVTHEPPAGAPAPGTVMEIDSLDYRGTFKKHEKRAFASDYLRCTWATDPENPDCYGYVAIGSSLLRFHNLDVVGGTNRYAGATGSVISDKEVPGGSENVVKIKLG
jgi:hypothetical protein